MDVCYNLALFENQCLFAGTHPRDARLRPLLVQSKTVHGGGITVPSTYLFSDFDGTNVTPWNERSSRVYWRGSNTGNCPSEHLRSSPRARLHMMAQNHPSISSDDVLKLLNEDQDEGRGSGLRMEEVSLREFNAKFMDVGMVGPAIQCGHDQDICRSFEEDLGLLPWSDSDRTGGGYKYTIDVGKFFLLAFKRLVHDEHLIFYLFM